MGQTADLAWIRRYTGVNKVSVQVDDLEFLNRVAEHKFKIELSVWH